MMQPAAKVAASVVTVCKTVATFIHIYRLYTSSNSHVFETTTVVIDDSFPYKII